MVNGTIRNYIRGLEYDDEIYVTFGLPTLHGVSYSRDGLLLYIELGYYFPLEIFPSIIVRLFGFTDYTWSIDGGIIIKLFDLSLFFVCERYI